MHMQRFAIPDVQYDRNDNDVTIEYCQASLLFNSVIKFLRRYSQCPSHYRDPLISLMHMQQSKISHQNKISSSLPSLPPPIVPSPQRMRKGPGM